MWAKKLQDEEKINFCRKEIAETYAKQADSCAPDLSASHWMMKAVEAYKKVPGNRESKDEIYKRLREYQKFTVENMSQIKGPKTDISEIVAQSIKTVKGHSFDDALFHFCFGMISMPNFEELKERAKDESNQSVLGQLFGAVHYDRQGLVVAEVPAMSGLADTDDDKALWSSMLGSLEFIHSFSVQGSIEPARREILLEHCITESSFHQLLQNNPIIPDGHEVIFAKGLNFGFHGDFISAIHILIPQLENLLRNALKEHGVETTTHNTQGIQENILLKAILTHDVFIQVFGQDLSLELHAVLLDRKYANLRNDVSHGLMPSNYFYTMPSVYLWWITLRLCLLPFYSQWNTARQRNPPTNNRS